MRISRVAAVLALGCAAAALAGCGGRNYRPPQPADSTVARTALESALGAWRSQANLEALQQATPSITFVDPDCQSGQRLLDFQLQPGEQPLGSSIYWPVQLRIAPANGREQRLDVTYIVSTNPLIHISRQD
jgi:hypothetical protein